MRHQINEHITVVEGDGVVYVTRPSMITNKINTAAFIGADPAAIVNWLVGRFGGGRPRSGISNQMVQDAFPNLNDGEREFLMTGITPKEWATYLKGDNDGNE